MRKAVRHGAEVRHGAHARKPAACRRQGAGFHRLFIRKSRLSKMHMHIDQTGKNDDIRFFQYHGPGRNGNAQFQRHQRAVFQKRIRARKLSARIKLRVFENKRHALTSFFAEKNPAQRRDRKLCLPTRQRCTYPPAGRSGSVIHPVNSITEECPCQRQGTNFTNAFQALPFISKYAIL